MSYKQELQNNNVDLQSILDMINALPSDGGSGSIDVELIISTTTNPSNFPAVVENAILIAYDA